MRKSVAAFFLVLICLLMTACGSIGSDIRQPVSCYYPRITVSFGAEDSVISFEEREGSGHMQDLGYLLSMYLQGPMDPELVSPFPEGTQIASILRDGSLLQLRLDGHFQAQTDLQRSLACACLSMTAFGLCDAESIEIIVMNDNGEEVAQHILTRDSLLLTDTSEHIPETTKQEE